MTNPCFISATFGTDFFSPFSRFNDYNKRITTHDNGNVQSHGQEESELSSTINVNSGAHTLIEYKKIKNSMQ